MNERELRQALATLHEQMRAIWKDSMSSDELAKFDELSTRAQEIEGKLAPFDAANARRSRIDGLGSYLGESQGRKSDPLPHQDPNNTRNGLHQYSILRAVDLKLRNQPLTGLELEVNDELASRSGKSAKGIYVPWDLAVRHGAGPAEARDLDTTAGAGVIPTFKAGTIIEFLRANTIISQLGATLFTDLTGKFSLPKQTATTTAQWVTEGNAATASNVTIGAILMEPSTLTANGALTRLMLAQQGNIDVEMFARQDLARTIALALDAAAIKGSGVGAEPEGLTVNSSVQVVAIGTNGGDPTFAKLVEMETVAADTDADLSGAVYLTTVRARGKMKVTQKVSGQAVMLWENNEINGYRAFANTQVPKNLTKGTGTNLSVAIFGDFRHVMMAFWGGFDLLVDPYTAANSGTVKLNVFQDADIAFRYANAFSIIKDMVTA